MYETERGRDTLRGAEKEAENTREWKKGREDGKGGREEEWREGGREEGRAREGGK